MIARMILMLALTMALSACSSVDRGRCLEDHMQVVMVPMIIGKNTIMTSRMQNVCDRWEYPEGRPA